MATALPELSPGDDAPGVASDEQFLIGGVHPQLDTRAGPIKTSFASTGQRRVHAGVHRDAEPVEPTTNSLANRRGVLADTSGEDNRVRSIHRRQVCAEVFLHAI